MQRRNLHLNALRTFETAARKGSLTKAAAELGVTHAAISHQIKHLENLLGVKLLERTPKGVELTESGQSILPVLTDSFDRIGAALEALMEGPLDRLTVTTTPVFASHWLVPRLSKWQCDAKKSNVHVLPTLSLLDLARGEADVAIRCGLPNWGRELDCEKLSSISMTPVCSRDYIRQVPDLNTPKDLSGHTLIHADVDMADAGYEWRAWFETAAVPETAGTNAISFHDPALAMQAALKGLGIAMGYTELIKTEMAEQRLVQPFSIVAVHPFSYYLVYAKSIAGRPEIRQFADWVLEEMLTATDRPAAP